MALNFYSKHGIIIGVFTMISSLLLSLSEIYRIAYIFRTYDYSSSFRVWYKFRSITTVILLILTGVFSAFLIFGIVKKRHMLMAPWLVVWFLLSAFISVTQIYEAVASSYFYLINYTTIFMLIGLSIVILNPIWHLFTEIRSGKFTAGNL